MSRPPLRRSTALLIAVFLLALVTYILVRPAPPSAHAAPAVPAPSSDFAAGIAA